ncbi:Membrane dipeptidase (Peptidase family M19) [Jannaschia seosinensis]|uniref:Membrane dipeptidase (Peptidase family M19) n=1 Tax=Jannaschia seosinensis TaxID=313367 RepID=A0A0M7B821_9RHOB|nr:dipeptidase [Jannaschia seosinensis]CUH12010.1 Membrane dipeptidase (Peptidase family M19) [Jannaschia seosinensis]
MDNATPPIFDGHNDTLTYLAKSRGSANFQTGTDGQLDLPKARAGGFGGGFFACWVPSEEQDFDRDAEMARPEYDLPLPAPVEQDRALRAVLAEAAELFRLDAAGHLKVCTSATDIRTVMDRGQIAAVFHLEGAEAIDPDFDALEVLYRAGLRSIGLVWSRPTIFAEGVPFRYPSSPDIGGGLTDQGKRLVEYCNRLKVMIDLSHLNEAGFRDVARLSNAPLVATHSNAHAICPHARNLTDRQLAVIAESGGLVGVNFAVAFLREDGRMIDDVPLEEIIRHLDHLIDKLGEDGVGFGSDFDGATIPRDLANAARLTKLREAMRAHGYDEALMTKLCHGNWLRVLERTWGE